MNTNDGQELQSSFGLAGSIAQPGSGATITLWLSTDNRKPTQTARIKRLIINVYSSAASATNGLQIDENNSANADGTPASATWRNLTSYTIAATTYTKNIVAVSAPFIRVRYVNSASVLTNWEYSVLSDEDERGTQ